MAVGRRPQPQERAFGGEVVGVANAALAVFLILAFHSYRAGDAQANQMGLVGYLLADLLCPALGRACYLLPGALLYGAAVLFHLLRCPAAFSQAVSLAVFSLSLPAFLALCYEGRPVAEAGGWIGGFLALHLRTGLNRLGAYIALLPFLLVSFVGMAWLSLRGAGEQITTEDVHVL